jgi:SAM-dependent methyltransferase
LNLAGVCLRELAKLELERVPCILCGNAQNKIVLATQDYALRTPGEFCLVGCTQCGLIYTNPRPTAESIALCYPENYEPYLHDTATNQKYGGKWRLWLENTAEKAYLKLYRRYQNIKLDVPLPLAWLLAQPRRADFLRINWVEGGKVLDVGCSTGRYLEKLQRYGWDVYGVESNPIIADYARQKRGLNIHAGTLEAAEFPAQFFDAIVFSHVLEHLHDPLAELQEVRRILKPGGQLVIALPNWGSLGRKLFKEHWMALEIPRHLYHFDVTHLRRLLEKAGFNQITAINYNFLSGIWLQSVLHRRGKNVSDLKDTKFERIYGRLVRNIDRLTVPELIFNWLELSDIIEVSATYNLESG